MKHTILLSFLLGCCIFGFCQTGKLAGLVQDAENKAALELATVSIFGQDSSLVTYQLSDKNGRFAFEKLPLKKSLFLTVTYTGYKGYRSSLQLNAENTDTLTVLLVPSQGDTNAVVVTTTVPIRMNGDTLEISPAAFRTKPDAVVEELLNQVPGITIWSDGTITVNGKKVQNLYVDGKPFLGATDPRVATQNLPKAAIDKIQLYQEYDRSRIGQESQPQDSLLTMNIKLKEESKKGYFGKAGAGYGTSSRFESDLSFQLYNKKSSAGIGGGFNNINKNIGNLQELFQNNTYRNYNPNLYSVGRFGANGINRNYSIGGIVTHNFIESINSRQNNGLTVNYNAAGTDAFTIDSVLQNRTTLAAPQLISEAGEQYNRNSRRDLDIRYTKTNSYNDRLNVNGAINRSDDRGQSSRYTEVRDTASRLQSTNSVTTQQNRQTENASLNVSFARSDNEDPLKSFNLQFNARQGNATAEREMTSVFQSFTDMRKNMTLRRRYVSANQSRNLSGSLDYAGFKRFLLGRYNLFGISLNFTQNFTYDWLSGNSSVDDLDSTSGKYIINPALTNRNTREVFEYTPALAMGKNFFKWSDRFYRSFNLQVKFLNDIKTDKNQSSFAKRNLARSFQFFRYEGNLSFQYQKREKYQYNLSAGYAKNFEYPSVDQLYTIVDDVNAYDIRIGNPYLQNRVNHRVNVNANFNTQYPKSVYSVNGNFSGGYTRSLYPVVDSLINDPSGKRLFYFTNADKSNQLNLNYNVNVSRRLQKSSLQLMYNGQFSAGKMPNYVDGVYNTSETGNFSHQVTFQFSLRSLLILNVSENLQRYKTKQSAAGLTPFQNTSHRTTLGMVLNYPAQFTFSSTVERVANANLVRPTVLWNAFASYRFLQQQGELKLSAMDVLKQYRNISNSVNAYGTTTRITNGLQQFFLLTFSYYPRKIGKTGMKKQSARDGSF